MFSRLLTFDREKLDVQIAVYAIIAIPLALALESIVGVVALQTGIAAVLVALVGRSGDLRTRVLHMVVFTAVGGAFGFLSYVSAETAWQAALVLAVVTYLTGLAYGLGSAAGRAGYLLLLWTLTVLIGEAHGGDPSETASAFLVGGIAAIIVVSVGTLVMSWRRDTDLPPGESVHGTGQNQSALNIGALVRSDLGVWSLVRAVLTAIAVLIGYQMTSDLDPFWTAIVLLIVFQPDMDKTRFKAVQRGLGTLAGALTATIVLESTDSSDLVVLLMCIVTFGAITFYSANYVIYAFCLTNAVLFYYWLAVDHETSGPSVRLAATIIGIALAISGMELVALLTRSKGTATQGAKSNI